MLFQSVHISDVKLGIGAWVKLLRTQRKLSQEELAKQLNLSRITIQNMERGNNFTIDTLLLVCQYFDELDSVHRFFQTKQEEAQPITSFYADGSK